MVKAGKIAPALNPLTKLRRLVAVRTFNEFPSEAMMVLP